jgi:hypothetical protein
VYAQAILLSAEGGCVDVKAEVKTTISQIEGWSVNGQPFFYEKYLANKQKLFIIILHLN